jgi:hypothetical protein
MSNFLENLGFGTVEFWDQIAGYAWNGFQKFGAGAVVVVEEDCQEDEQGVDFALRYLPETDESSLWAEQPLEMLEEYTPENEVLLIAVEKSGGAMCMIIETQEDTLTPPQAFEKLIEQNKA